MKMLAPKPATTADSIGLRSLGQASSSAAAAPSEQPPSYEFATSDAARTQVPRVPAHTPTPRRPQPSLASRAYTKTLSGLSQGLTTLRLPIATLMGAGITAGTTYALAKHVANLIATAQVSSDPQVWINAARTKAYDACYNGCDDCDDLDYAYNACAVTAAANVTGVECNGNTMWNWADRYPMPCLQVVGEYYKAQALADLKQKDRDQLAIIILTVLAGVLGGVVAYNLVGCIAARTGATARARRQANQGAAP